MIQALNLVRNSLEQMHRNGERYTHLALHPDTWASVLLDIRQSGGDLSTKGQYAYTLLGFIVEVSPAVPPGEVVLFSPLPTGFAPALYRTLDSIIGTVPTVTRQEPIAEKFKPGEWLPTVPHPLIEEDKKLMRVVELD